MKYTSQKLLLALCVSTILFAFSVYAGDSIPVKETTVDAVERVKQVEAPKGETPKPIISSKEFVSLSWETSSKGDLDGLEALTKRCLKIYGEEAKKQQKMLKDFPTRGEEENYQSLNDVGTCLFILAEALMNHGKTNEAVSQFQDAIEKYSWAQAWDPSRGTYWSIKEKSEASIKIIQGKTDEEVEQEQIIVKRTKPILHTVGTENIVDYTKYGEFKNVGKENYHYQITDLPGLAAAVGEGIYPNSSAVYNNPRYKVLKKEGRLKGEHWDFVNSDDLEAAYFKWVTAPEPWGVRLFYLGIIFEKAEMYYEALRSYHALVVHYPKTVAWTYWQTPWYPAQAGIAKIRYIIRTHPELNLDYKYMKIEVRNGFDNDTENDVIIAYPGKIVERSIFDKIKDLAGPQKIDVGKVKKRVGDGKVHLVQYENGHWDLMVDQKPYIIKGITYAPTKIGQSPDKGTMANWMEEDTNENGKADGPYDAWVDANGNNKQDENEPTVGDFQLMKEMGVNTLRIYHHPDVPNKELLRAMYKQYGFRVIMGDFLGKYTLGSGAKWFEGTDYENEEQKKNMMESVKEMVMKYKDEPYILIWALGNENNYGVASNADKKPVAYFKFADEVAQMIKSLDKNHPVSIVNGDKLFLDIFAKESPNIDIFSANAYRGDYGFGSFWSQVAEAADKPAYISEYGCPAYAKHLTLDEAEECQAKYHWGNWIDIEDNMARRARGAGNALGGFAFEWLDEWWKNYEPYMHDKKSDARGPFCGGLYYEEWFGLVGQGNGSKSPFMRHLRKVYFKYKDLWN